MSISFVEQLGGVFQVVKLTELMRHPWKHKGDGTANRFFAIRDHASDRHLKVVQLSFDFFEESRQVSLRTAEQRARQQDFLGEAVARSALHPPVGRAAGSADNLPEHTDAPPRSISTDQRAWQPSCGCDGPPRRTDHTAHNALSTGSRSLHAPLRRVRFVEPSSFS